MTTLDQMMPPPMGAAIYNLEDLVKLVEVRHAINQLDFAKTVFYWKDKNVRPSATFLSWWSHVGLSPLDMLQYFDPETGTFHAEEEHTVSGIVDLNPDHQQLHSQVLSLMAAHQRQEGIVYPMMPAEIIVAAGLARHIIATPEFAGSLYVPAVGVTGGPRADVASVSLGAQELIGHLLDTPVYAHWTSRGADLAMTITYRVYIK